MPDPLQTIVQRMIDAGEPEENIATVIKAYTPAASHESTHERTWTDTAVDALPTVGGIVGSIAGASGGPVLAAGGAAAGGMVGERLKQYANAYRGTQPLPAAGDAIKDIAGSGLTQAGTEVGGQFVGRLMKAGAGRLYQSVLKPGIAAMREHPNLIETGLEHAIPVTEGGAEKAGTLLGRSKDAADALVSDAAAQPGAPTIDPRRAIGGITKAVREVKDLPVARPQMKAIGDYGRAYIKEHPAPMSLEQAQRAVRATDRFFDPAYRATMDKGNAITSGQTAAALGINNETRNLLRQAVPGLREQNAETQALAGIKDAIQNRLVPQGNRSLVGAQHYINAGLGLGAGAFTDRQRGIETFLAAEALTNPAVASRLAIGAAKTSRLPFAQAVRAAVLARLIGETGTEESPPR